VHGRLARGKLRKTHPITFGIHHGMGEAQYTK
jgi:hypothetical protein